MSEDRSLLHARRSVGRPRKVGHVSGTSDTGDRDRGGQNGRPPACDAIAPLLPRLLDLNATAAYLGVSPWTVRDLEVAGTLKRVRIPQADQKDIRKLLFDRLELDRLIEAWKDRA